MRKTVSDGSYLIRINRGMFLEDLHGSQKSLCGNWQVLPYLGGELAGISGVFSLFVVTVHVYG